MRRRALMPAMLGLGLALAGCGDSGLWPPAHSRQAAAGQVQSTTLVDTSNSASTLVERRRIDPRPDTLIGVFR